MLSHPQISRVFKDHSYLATLLEFLDHLDHCDGNLLPIIAQHGASDWVHPCLRLFWWRWDCFLPLLVAAQLKARLHPTGELGMWTSEQVSKNPTCLVSWREFSFPPLLCPRTLQRGLSSPQVVALSCNEAFSSDRCQEDKIILLILSCKGAFSDWWFLPLLDRASTKWVENWTIGRW